MCVWVEGGNVSSRGAGLGATWRDGLLELLVKLTLVLIRGLAVLGRAGILP